MKYNSRLLFLFFFCSLYSFSQQTKAENLFNKIEGFIEGNSRDSIIKYNKELLEISRANKESFYYGYALMNGTVFNNFSKPDSELNLNKALSIFKRKNNSRYILLAYENLAKINRSKSNPDKASRYSDSIISVFKNKKRISGVSRAMRIEFLLSAYHSISGNLYFQGEYEEALKNELIAKKYADSLVSENFEKIDIGLGMINIALGRHNKARETFKNLIKNSESKPIRKFGFMSLATSFYEKREHDSSIFYYEKAKLLSEDMKDFTGLAHIYTNIGINQTALGNIDEAEKNLLEAISISNKYKINNAKETSLIGMGEVYIKQGKLDSAIDILLKVQDSAIATKRFPIIRDSYELLSEAYYNKKDYKKALEFRERFITLKDSIKSADIIKNSEELQVKYQTEKKEKENLKLKQQTIEKDLSISQKNNIILISSLIFGLIIISLISYQLKKFRNKNKALQASIEQREKVEKELETVRDNISKDFHDDLGNRLARITSLSDLILTTSSKRDKENVLSAIEKIKEDSDVLYNGTRDFMFSLKAKSDYAEELFTYLSDFGEEFFQPFKIDFFVTKKIDRNVKLPYYWNRQIIMIFKEAMTNIAKHSDAKNVELHITLDNNDLFISLKDDGKGFYIEKLKRKNGLLNMESRARKINSALLIISNEKGTRVNFDAYLPE